MNTSKNQQHHIRRTLTAKEMREPFNDIDIQELKEFYNKIEPAYTIFKKDRLTNEDHLKIRSELDNSGTIPEEYLPRIVFRPTKIYAEIINGETITHPDGVIKLLYYDKAEETYNKAIKDVKTEYQDLLAKVIYHIPEKYLEEDEIGTFTYRIEEYILQLIQPAPDFSNLPTVLLTDDRLRYALTTYENKYAYIANYEMNKFDIAFDANGEAVIKPIDQIKPKENNIDQNAFKIKAAEIDQPLLRQLFTAVYKSKLCSYGDTITVNTTKFAREMGIDIVQTDVKARIESTGESEDSLKHNPNNLFQKLAALEKLGGVWEGNGYYAVLKILKWDNKAHTLTFASPWLYKIAEESLNNPIKKEIVNKGVKKAETSSYNVPGISYLLKPTHASARSKPTIAIIDSLIIGIVQYGVTPEAKRHKGKTYEDQDLVQYRIKLNTLISRIPLIYEALKDCNPKNRTTLLQRYFCGTNFKKRLADGKGYIIDEYITKYTYLRECYKDFCLTFTPPTANNLDNYITITHHGKEGSFNFVNTFTKEILEYQNKTQGKDAEKSVVMTEEEIRSKIV